MDINLKITPGWDDLQGLVFCPSLCRSVGLIGKFKCSVKVHFLEEFVRVDTVRDLLFAAGLIKICLLVKLGDCSYSRRIDLM